jgi:hypothetical protein
LQLTQDVLHVGQALGKPTCIHLEGARRQLRGLSCALRSLADLVQLGVGGIGLEPLNGADIYEPREQRGPRSSPALRSAPFPQVIGGADDGTRPHLGKVCRRSWSEARNPSEQGNHVTLIGVISGPYVTSQGLSTDCPQLVSCGVAMRGSRRALCRIDWAALPGLLSL